ncbi:MAG TPA: biotin/lipoyl-binding protein, partial [Thermodesulfobacteriota bacterium]|nr:biotin/lipoyl-binding protein [Thermodesulfobacteriota bacterium]
MNAENVSSDRGRRLIGRVLGIVVVGAAAIAAVVTLLQREARPQTDDATVRANFVGMAPQVSGHIMEIHVRDNQQVRKGDLLFVIDERPYRIALDRARAALALTRKEVDGLTKGVETAAATVSRAQAQLNASEAEVVRRETEPVAADAEIAQIEAKFNHAEQHLRRLEPLLPRQFVTTDRVEEARTQRDAARAALDEARARKEAAVAALASTRAQHIANKAALEQAQSERGRAVDAVGQVADMNARIAAAEAAMHAAELDLGYCRVYAPFSGKVVNLNISPGAFARAGAEVFTLVDTSTWYVMANFREVDVRH